MLDQDRCDFCVARKHVDFAIDSLYARGHEHTMARSRRLMERAADEDDPNDVDAEHAILARVAAREKNKKPAPLAPPTATKQPPPPHQQHGSTRALK